MNIRKYEAFARAVELGSLSKAAEELGYTQSGISHMMQSLEEEVGFPLLVRTSAGIQPNHEGELLLPVIRQLLNTSESLEQYIAKIKGADTGRIRVAAYTSVATYWLPGIIRDFQKDYPNVEIQIIEMGSGAIEQIMRERKADLCIYAGGEGQEFEWVPLCRDRMLALVPPELLLKNYGHSAVALPMDPPQERMLGMGVPQLRTASPVTRNFMEYVKRYVLQEQGIQ